MSGTPDQPRSDDLTALETRLRQLVPADARLARDEVFYRAGLAAGRGGRFWPACTAASALLAASLGVVLISRPAPAVVEVRRTVYVRAAEPAPSPERPGSREDLFRWSLDGQGPPPAFPSAPADTPLLSSLGVLEP